MNVRFAVLLATAAGSVLPLSGTTTADRVVPCGNCGKAVLVQRVGSTSSFGNMDMDTRPAPPARYLVYNVLQCCTNCGYCAFDVTQTVSSGRMRKALSRRILPQTQDERYLWAATLASLGGAGKWDCVAYLLRAAWVADDLRTKQGDRKAREYRRQAIRHLREHIQSGSFARPEHQLLLADLLRRTGSFDEALAVVSKLSLGTGESGRFFEKLACQEAELCRAGDDSARSVKVK